jgi:hypothetical protein
MLVLFPVVAALLAVVTAVTYQFQGWLASLMANKRRRRTIITFVTAGFILVAQIPSLLNLMGFLESSSRRMKKEIAEIERALEAGQINSDEYQRQTEAVRAKYEEESEGPSRESVERIAGLVNVVVPVAWPAHAARRAAEDALLPALAVTVGLALIAAASLRRSYRTTVSLYTGEFSSGKRRAPTVSETRAASPATSQPARSSLTLLETRLPWLSEQVSAIAVASFRSLTRAPEAKMVLLGPVIMLVVLGAMFMRGNMASSEFFRPLAATGAITLILLGVNQLGANQFGFDRSGFRAFVLGPVSRKDILLGKNLSLAPLAVGMSVVAMIVIEILSPMRLDHFVAMLAEIIPMYLVYCMVANTLSMLAPLPVASGSLKPVQPKGMAILLHLAFVFVFAFVMALTQIPLGLELLINWFGWGRPFPVFLVLALMECAGVVYLYRFVLRLQGEFLQSREQKILEIVTSKIE